MFINKCLLWHRHAHVCLFIVAALFRATMAAVSSGSRDVMAHKAWHASCLALYRKKVLIPQEPHKRMYCLFLRQNNRYFILSLFLSFTIWKYLHFAFTFFLIEIIIDLHSIVWNNMRDPLYIFFQFSPIVTFWKTVKILTVIPCIDLI